MGVPTAKVYLTYDGRLNEDEILKVLERARGLEVLTAFHAENDAVITALREQFRAEGKLSPMYHPLSRPDYCETEAIQRILHLAETTGGVPVYIVHLSTASGLKVIEEARGRGVSPIVAVEIPWLCAGD